MDSEHFMLLSELFDQFRQQALMLLKDAEECGFIDDTTGCYNRKAYELRKTQLTEITVGVIFVDVNGLKYVNDTKGHASGDVLLRDLGKMLKAYFGGNDVFRVGGDEFIIFKPNVKPEVFTNLINEFRTAIDTMHKTTVAIGCSINNDLEKALKEAETQMYIDKENFYKRFPQYKRK